MQMQGTGMEAAVPPAFPRSAVHATAAASFATWWAVTLVVHIITRLHWKGYASLQPLERRQWCNKVTSGLHAAALAYSQAGNLGHPALLADPLGLSGQPPAFHYFWASVLAGYLAYDTAYGLTFYSLSSAAPFLAHHVIGLVGCALGVYRGRLALFGLAIEVWFEGTTPLLHLVGCMKIARLQGTRLYRTLAAAFAAQFFLFRVVVANGYLAWLLRAVLQLEAAPGWAWAGVTVFAALSALNLFWFAKLLAMARGGVSNRGEGHGEGDRSGLGGSSGAARAARRSAGVNVTFELVGGGKGSKAA